jgi:hypothetical protein
MCFGPSVLVCFMIIIILFLFFCLIKISCVQFLRFIYLSVGIPVVRGTSFPQPPRRNPHPTGPANGFMSSRGYSGVNPDRP